MKQISFEALGTHWEIFLDQLTPNNLPSKIFSLCKDFEKKYSRFLPNSEISEINQNKSTLYTPSKDLRSMLKIAQILKELSSGIFDPNVVNTLESYGYDSNYSFKKKALPTKKGDWILTPTRIKITPPVKFDLGSIGKGYMIDKLAEYLINLGYRHFLISGGGDIKATTKKDGSPWKVGIPHPKRSDYILKTINLTNMAIATSSPQYRQVGSFHHLINAHNHKPTGFHAQVSVITKKATLADALATALFITPQEYWQNFKTNFSFNHYAISRDLHTSSDIPPQLIASITS